MARSGAFRRRRRRNEPNEPGRRYARGRNPIVSMTWREGPGRRASEKTWSRRRGRGGRLLSGNEPSRRRRNEPGRRRRRNEPSLLGGKLSRSLGSFGELMSTDFLVDAAEVGVGSVATPLATAGILSLVKKDDWNYGVKGYVTQLIVAGLLGTAAGFLRQTRLARNVMLGGVAGVAAGVMKDVVLPMVGVPTAVAPVKQTATTGTSGLGLTAAQRMVALPSASGINDFIVGQGGRGINELADFVVTRPGVAGLGDSGYGGALY